MDNSQAVPSMLLYQGVLVMVQAARVAQANSVASIGQLLPGCCCELACSLPGPAILSTLLETAAVDPDSALILATRLGTSSSSSVNASSKVSVLAGQASQYRLCPRQGASSRCSKCSFSLAASICLSMCLCDRRLHARAVSFLNAIVHLCRVNIRSWAAVLLSSL